MMNEVLKSFLEYSLVSGSILKTSLTEFCHEKLYSRVVV
jgi:hypothetical protein